MGPPAPTPAGRASTRKNQVIREIFHGTVDSLLTVTSISRTSLLDGHFLQVPNASRRLRERELTENNSKVLLIKVWIIECFSLKKEQSIIPANVNVASIIQYLPNGLFVFSHLIRHIDFFLLSKNNNYLLVTKFTRNRAANKAVAVCRK